jgi:hypothetical protein
MVNLTEVMSAGGTIDAVVYIYSDGVCEVEINSSTQSNEIVEGQSDAEYGLMIDNYVDTMRKFGEMKEGEIVINSDMIPLSSVQNGGVPPQDGQEQVAKAAKEVVEAAKEDNGDGDEAKQNEEHEVQPQDKVQQINQEAIAEEEESGSEEDEEAEVGHELEYNGESPPLQQLEDKPVQPDQDGLHKAEDVNGEQQRTSKDDGSVVDQQNKISYAQVKTYLETRPNTYTMYDLLTCKWISILNNEISPLDAVDKIKKDEDLKDTIYNPVLNAFYKKNVDIANTTTLDHTKIKKYETQDNIRFSHFEEFWEYNNTSTKWIYGRWINGTEYKFKYDNGWLIT